MPRTITIKGTGTKTVSPDLVIITMTLRSKDKDYDKMMQSAAKQLDALEKALSSVGFDEKALKTTSWNVTTENESVRGDDGNYRSVFSGYVCSQDTKLEFPLDMSKLSDTLSAVSKSLAEPEISVRFTVRDKEAVNEDILREATANALKKAKLLAASSGVRLGMLLSIDYSAGGRDYFSRTDYVMDNRCMALGASAKMSMTPDDITVSDSATFVWELG